MSAPNIAVITSEPPLFKYLRVVILNGPHMRFEIRTKLMKGQGVESVRNIWRKFCLMIGVEHSCKCRGFRWQSEGFDCIPNPDQVDRKSLKVKISLPGVVDRKSVV